MAQRVASGGAGRMNRRFLLVAILLAALSAALVYAKISSGGSSSSNVSSAGAGEQQVVVAKIPIQQRTTVTADMLEVKNVSANAVTTGAYTNIQEVVGKVTKFPVEVNQQVSTTAVVDTSKPNLGEALAPVVPAGKRAFSISANQVSTAGGLLLPGDYIDVIWVCCKNGIEGPGNNGKTFTTSAIVFSRPIVQNVQVAAVAQQIVPSGPVGSTTPVGGASDANNANGNPVAANQPKQVPDASTITLLLTPAQADILLMAENTGILRTALRNPGDEAIIPPADEIQFLSPGLLPPDVLRILQDTFAQK